MKITILKSKRFEKIESVKFKLGYITVYTTFYERQINKLKN